MIKMIIEVLYHIFSFDITWLFDFIASNLLWLFIFPAIAHFFWGGKNFIQATVLLIAVIFSWSTFEATAGIVFFIGGFLMFYYSSKFVALKIAEETPSLREKMYLISTLQGVVLLVLYNVFMVL